MLISISEISRIIYDNGKYFSEIDVMHLSLINNPMDTEDKQDEGNKE